ncbi:hypothetical protein CMI37_36890 [Candidatus Pacearchaeota archaeon]|nr:hypothetical protein [Candidatus Pacearchaeota archaeon]|tara:strand:+ start:1792 stop:4449 length:2658 start_codon:yes stop_codon:yes gene_type:complete
MDIDYTKAFEKGAEIIERGRKKEIKVTKEARIENKKLQDTYKTQTQLLNELVVGQKRMVSALNKISASTIGATRNTRNLNRQNLLWVKNTRILGGSLAVLRSKLLVFTFGIALLERSIGKLLSSYGDFEASQKRIGRVIKSTGGAAGITKEEIFAMNAAFEKSTSIAETTINQVSALLLTFTNIGGDVIPQVTEAVLDMTVVMYQGNVTLESLKTTSIQVGKALNDPIKGLNALKRVGVSFNAQQKSIIRALQNTNQLTKAQGIILEELEKEFGDQATLKTYNKAVLALDTSIGNLSKRMGEELRPAIEPLIISLTELIDTLDASEVIDFLQSIAMVTIGFGVLRKTLALSLVANGKHIKSMAKLGKVLKLTAFNFVGLTSGVRKMSLATRALTVGLRALTGPLGFGLLVMSLLPSFLGLIDSGSKGTKDLSDTFEGAKKQLKDYKDEIKAAGNSHKDLMDIAVKYNAVEVGGIIIKTAASISSDKLTIALEKRRVELENNIEALRLTSVVTGDSRTKAEKLSDEVFKQVKKYEQLNFILDATYSGDHIKNVQDYDKELGSLLYIDKQLVKEKKLLATVVSALGINIDTTTGDLLSYEEAIKNIPPELRHLLDINLELNTAIDAQNALRKVNIDLAKQTIDANIEMSSALVSSLNSISTSWHNMKISQLEAQAALEIKTVEESVRSEKAKANAISAIEKKLFEDKKKLHNNNILIQQAAVVAEFAIAAQRVTVQMQIAKAAMTASLLASGVGILGIIGALASLDAMLTKSLITIGAASVASIGALQMQRMAHGGDFETAGPQMIMVGDNPGGRERVQVTPLSSPNIAGPQGGGSSITVNVSGNVMTEEFTTDQIIPALTEALRRGENLDHTHINKGGKTSPPEWG